MVKKEVPTSNLSNSKAFSQNESAIPSATVAKNSNDVNSLSSCDLTRLEEANLQVKYRDPLTGIHNRLFYQESICNMNVAENIPLTIIFCDINKLKLVNDTLGCTLGDQLLKSFSVIFRTVIRPGDELARIEDDEFAFLLPKTDETIALQMIEQIKKEIQNDPANFLKISVAFGFHTKHHFEENITDVVRDAKSKLDLEKTSEKAILLSKTILLILTTLFERNRNERDHSKRVSAICVEIGKSLGFNPAEIHNLKIAGMMHDIGKITINETILHKKGSLNRGEWIQIQNHAEAGYRILNSVTSFSKIALSVLQHHEKWDGTGYPNGLKGEGILLNARIIAIAEAFDALTSKKTYRTPLTIEEALAEIKRCSGTQFDPKITQVFLSLYTK